MSRHWPKYCLSYSDTVQASGEELLGAWRLEHAIPVIPLVNVSDYHNWIRGRPLKIKMQMAVEVLSWNSPELFVRTKNVAWLLECEQPRFDHPWRVAREAGNIGNTGNQMPSMRATQSSQLSADDS